MQCEDHREKVETDWALACVRLCWVVVAIAAFVCYDTYTQYQAAQSSWYPLAGLGPSLGYGMVGAGALIVSLTLTATALCLGERSRWLASGTMIVVVLLGLLWRLMSPP